MKRSTAETIVEYVKDCIVNVYENGNDCSDISIEFEESMIDKVLKLAKEGDLR